MKMTSIPPITVNMIENTRHPSDSLSLGKVSRKDGNEGDRQKPAGHDVV